MVDLLLGCVLALHIFYYLSKQPIKIPSNQHLLSRKSLAVSWKKSLPFYKILLKIHQDFGGIGHAETWWSWRHLEWTLEGVLQCSKWKWPIREHKNTLHRKMAFLERMLFTLTAIQAHLLWSVETFSDRYINETDKMRRFSLRNKVL